jgi:SAM-dependent methyltransferase
MSIIEELVNQIPKIKVPDKTNLEIECRFIIATKHTYENVKVYRIDEIIKLAKSIINLEYKHEIEQSINFLKNIGDQKDSSKIQQIKFVNGVKDPNYLYYMKYHIMNPIFVLGSMPYRIVASFEQTINSFPTSECEIARIKLRNSTYIGNWRIDITLVKNIPNFNNPAQLKAYKEEMLYEISTKTFAEKAPWKTADTIEFEAEFIGKTLTIDDFVKLTELFHEDQPEQNLYQQKIYEIAKTLNRHNLDRYKEEFGMKQLGNQPIELDRNIYLRDVQSIIENFYITDKIDGKRTLLYFNDNNLYILNDKIETVKDAIDSSGKFIFDCEEYKLGDKTVYYIFDVLVWDSITIIKKPFSDRYSYFKNAAKLYDAIKLKPFVRLTDKYREQIREMKEAKKNYETDGLILTPYDGLYDDMKVYKYKSGDRRTIDFLIKKCPSKLLGIKPYCDFTNSMVDNKQENKLNESKSNEETVYFLFSGIDQKAFHHLRMTLIDHYETLFPNLHFRHLPQYFPIQFETSDYKYAYLFASKQNDLDGQVGEFYYNIKYSCWELKHLRLDRQVEVQRGNYFGNNYHLAESIWFSYRNPLSIEDESDTEVYFQAHQSTLHQASRSYNRYVVSQIFQQYRGTSYAMDLASGKGQDLFRYAECEIKNVLFVEIDKTALMELISRKKDFAKSHNKQTLSITVQNLDLNANYKTNIEQITQSNINVPRLGYDLIMCNFAFHYFVSSQTSFNNIMKFISHYLKPAGYFVFTTFDGKKVFDLLEKHNGHWNSKTPGKYSIKAEYKTGALMTIGQKISVLLPFSKDKYYEEYLVNMEYLEKEFNKFNLTLDTNESFNTYMSSYHAKKDLDEDDIIYTGLYHYYCLQMSEKKGGKRKV